MAKRRRNADDPAEKTERVCLSMSGYVVERLKVRADKANISLSNLMEQLAQAYLRTRKQLEEEEFNPE